MIVAVLGASPKKERFSNQAVRALRAAGHKVIPINPAHKEIEGLATLPSLSSIKGSVDTLTVYIGPQNIGPMISDIVKLNPQRVILNPGAESTELTSELKAHNIPYIEDCTLVMLRAKTF